MRTWATEFKQFLLRGNVIDLAVAFVIGAAFAALVQAAVADLLTPLVAAIFGQPDFSNLSFTINGSVFRYGHFLNVLIAFVTIAFVVFFFVVKPINRLMELSRRRESPDPTTRKCPECLSEIAIDARGAPSAPPRCRRSNRVAPIDSSARRRAILGSEQSEEGVRWTTGLPPLPGGVRPAAGALERLRAPAGRHLPVHQGARDVGAVRGRRRGSRGLGLPLRPARHQSGGGRRLLS
jgi:large conductance mechanosensitive channel